MHPSVIDTYLDIDQQSQQLRMEGCHDGVFKQSLACHNMVIDEFSNKVKFYPQLSCKSHADSEHSYIMA